VLRQETAVCAVEIHSELQRWYRFFKLKTSESQQMQRKASQLPPYLTKSRNFSQMRTDKISLFEEASPPRRETKSKPIINPFSLGNFMAPEKMEKSYLPRQTLSQSSFL